MSTALNRTSYNRTSRVVEFRPHRKLSTQLRLIPTEKRRTHRFSFLCVGILFTGIVLVLLASIYISHTTYQIDKLSEKQEQLHSERDRLSEDISYRQSPQNIVEEARSLGLVPASKVAFITPDGKLVESENKAGRYVGTIPGPRADTRNDVRPNLRSDETLPAVGSGGRDLQAPHLKQP